ncbi:MAG: hypothetical protein A2521_10845 [Deltaproteobacteria bacterium RIFOXYD12_FULL_57_12]|nr:MAG: hypothetical protein A2521_10845 [Deltaproteobacteria bacterium RIFOXYD12_FULL_57_12]
MRIAAGLRFYQRFGRSAQDLWPAVSWALLGPGGGWSTPPQHAEIAVLIDDAYCPRFKEAMLAAPNLCWVHTENSGIDELFYKKILVRNVLLTRSPGANGPETAEFVFAVILRAVKRLGELHCQQQRRCWQRLELEGLGNKTILVIGLGAVGGRVAELARAFGMHVLGIRKKQQPTATVDEIGTLDSLPAFLPRADVVVLALPLSPATRQLFGDAQFRAMKDTVILVNVARGELVDIQALRIALAAKPAMQACLDVMPEEPWPADDDLWQMPNVLLTPHVAWSSPLYRPRAAALWLDNLTRYRQGLPLLHQVMPDRC